MNLMKEIRVRTGKIVLIAVAVSYIAGVTLGSLVVQSAEVNAECDSESKMTSSRSELITVSEELSPTPEPLRSTIDGKEFYLSEPVVNELANLTYELQMAQKIQEGIWAMCHYIDPDGIHYPEDMPTILDIVYKLENRDGFFNDLNDFLE